MKPTKTEVFIVAITIILLILLLSVRSKSSNTDSRFGGYVVLIENKESYEVIHVVQSNGQTNLITNKPPQFTGAPITIIIKHDN